MKLASSFAEVSTCNLFGVPMYLLKSEKYYRHKYKRLEYVLQKSYYTVKGLRNEKENEGKNPSDYRFYNYK